MKLTPRVYDGLQRYVHGDFTRQKNYIIELSGIQRGEAILELGCGTGLLGHLFLQPYDYWGIDIDETRCRCANKRYSTDKFVVGDVTRWAVPTLPPFRYAFCHGLLHHLDDAGCKTIISTLFDTLNIDKFVTIEILRPSTGAASITHIFDNLIADMDEGKFVRTRDQYVTLFNSRHLIAEHVLNFHPHYPMKEVVLCVGR